MVTLQQLEYIIAVDQYQHFVEASKACFVTQPTLSMQIKKLEDDLGEIIFDRSKKPIVPTDLGKQIIAQARVTLAEFQKIAEVIKAYHHTIAGELHVGIIPTLAPYLLPLFVGAFTKAYPNVKVKIVELLTSEILNQLKKGLIDIGVLVTPIDEKGIFTQPLFYEEMFVYANKNHPFGSQDSVQVQELESSDLWMLSEGHCFRSQVVNLCDYNQDYRNKFTIEYESGSLETLKRMVQKEGGYTLIPELAIDEELPSSIVVKPFSEVHPLREVSLVYSRNFVKKRLIDTWALSIQNAIPKHMLDKHRGGVVEWW